MRSGTNWSQQAYLKASNTDAGDFFGTSVAVSGDAIVVGAFSEDSNATGADGDQGNNFAFNSGAAYVFERSGTSWSQQAYLKASNADAGDEFGHAVAVSGDTAVVGARREFSSATGVDGDQGDNSSEDAGAAYVFQRSGISWGQEAYLKASNTDANDGFGFSVAVSGDTVVAGATSEGSSATGIDGDQNDNSFFQAGAAYVYEVLPSECFLVIAEGPGNSPFFAIDHLFETQVGPTVEGVVRRAPRQHPRVRAREPFDEHAPRPGLRGRTRPGRRGRPT